MPRISRRKFLSTAVMGTVAAGPALLEPSAHGASATGQPEEPHIFYGQGEWNAAAFNKLLRARRSNKQLFDATSPDGEGLILHVQNTLTGLERGFGIPAKQILAVAALRAGANILNFDDYAWKKYQLGAGFSVTDPTTKKPAERNIYWHSEHAPDGNYPTDDPNDPRSMDRDQSLQALQRRGVQFLSCHVATEFTALGAVKRLDLKESQETVTRDLLAHMLPGVIAVPSMVSAISMLENHGRFGYMRL